MTAAELRAEIRALRLLPGGAWPRAMRLLEVLAEMLERLEAEGGAPAPFPSEGP